jgi:hypothetical protein
MEGERRKDINEGRKEGRKVKEGRNEGRKEGRHKHSPSQAGPHHKFTPGCEFLSGC